MSGIFARPRRVYAGLVVALVAFFALSAVGNSGTDQQNAKSSVGWIGSIGWGGFLLTILVALVFTVALVVRAFIRRRTEA